MEVGGEAFGMLPSSTAEIHVFNSRPLGLGLRLIPFLSLITLVRLCSVSTMPF